MAGRRAWIVALAWLAIAAGRGGSARGELIPLGDEFQVNTQTTGSETFPVAAMTADGRFVIAWQGGSGGAYRVFAQRFDAAGERLAGEFTVDSSHHPVQPARPAIAADADGDFIVVWHAPDSGDFNRVFARRFSSAGGPIAFEFQVNSYTPEVQFDPAVGMDAAGGLRSWPAPA